MTMATRAYLRPVRSCVILIALALVCPGVSSQAPPLPDSVVGAFYGNSNAVAFCPTTDVTKFPALMAWVRFDTKARSLVIDWMWTAEGAETYREIEEFALGYEPTAVCVQGSAGPILYVAGYVQRTGHVVLEKWTIENMALGSATQGTVFKSTMTKTVRREVIALWTDVGPLRGIAYHVTQDRLWLVEEEFPHRVWGLDPETDVRSLLFDASTHPELADYPSVWRMMVGTDAPDGGGFLILFKPYRAWARHPSKEQPSDLLFIMRDADLDGTTDEVAEITFEEFEDVRRYRDFDLAPLVVP